MNNINHQAFGHPGIPATWTSSAKSGVGAALNAKSRVWFTLSHGILDEVYYPRIDRACTRDLGLLVADGRDFFSEEKRHTHSKVEYMAPGVPAFHLHNTCAQGRYHIEKQILADPQREVILQHIQFVADQGALSDYHLYALLAPHLGNYGSGNTAWVGQYKGVPMLFARREAIALALVCSVPWLQGSAGFAGYCDGWQDVERHKEMTWQFHIAAHGNVALIGEVDLAACNGTFVLALGFGTNMAEAGHRALASLQDGFDTAKDEYIQSWQAWQESVCVLSADQDNEYPLYRTSMAVIRIHEAGRFPGGFIASLSIPWGFAKGDDDLGGYHLVWPRDLVETACGLLAGGGGEETARVLAFLQVTQEKDGHWPQNMWLDGSPYWDRHPNG